ncbi:hypothetical protein [Winogradskyella immobilis]|uniref:Beta-carotene 15,15'-monooxygenase n=1 Tax=Winogradskyella immobilis TaxID=2816852 RepID=A0ABS8ENQ0_9FLAO|nr:hypothetical protein [Winogradskyella immobilis]MCC1484855.1 hypothetical protein [Winogradskyella immobilis]MCG0016947.1 hypothetical protein [Winogradskyella immobilis]
MNTTSLFKRNLVIFGIPVLLIISLIFLTKTSVFIDYTNSLSNAITIDILLIVPFIYYLLIRKTKIPKTTVVPFIILGIVICSFILPKEHQNYLNLFKSYILPVIELSLASFIIYNVRKAIIKFKAEKVHAYDFYTTLKNTCYQMLPRAIVIPFITEIAVFYYGFIYWKKRRLNSNEFSYHKDSGGTGLYIAILFLIAIETVAFHLLLMQWNHTAAWILTLISIYSGIQIFGFLKSIYKRPIAIENNTIYLRYGILKETNIAIDSIASIELSSKEITTEDSVAKLSILGDMESHNVIIRLKEENTLTGLYGKKRAYKTLLLHVDEKVEFKYKIDTYISTNL